MSDDLTLDQQRFAIFHYYNQSNYVANEVNKDEALRKRISTHVCNYIMERIREMTDLSKRVTAFDYEKVVRLTVNQALELSKPKKIQIHWQPTQSGKTAFKVVKIIVYLTLNMPVVVITKGRGESKELEKKISGFLENSRFEGRVFSVYEDWDVIEKSFRNTEKANVLVIPDTHQKIEYADKLLSYTMKRAKKKNRRITGCALILDEADAIIDRTEDETQENEKALKKLLTLKPSLVMVTATPIPIFKYLDSKPIVITESHQEIPDYHGVGDIKHIGHVDKASLHEGFRGDFSPQYIHEKKGIRPALFPTDIPQKRYMFPNTLGKIPYLDDQCIDFLHDEMDKDNVKGTLALIGTCPWINPESTSSIFHQAAGTQDYFFCEKINIIVIVVHSTNIYYRLPGDKYGFKCNKSTTVGDLVHQIDSEFGLRMPVVVFGYHAMKRSRSFRSTKRVPTCGILCPGEGQSNENCRQAAGRLTFIGKTSNVSILCPTEIFDMIQKHDRLVREMIALYNNRESMTWKEVCSSLSNSKNNYLADSSRRTGNYVPGQSKKRKNQKVHGNGEKAAKRVYSSSATVRTKQSRSVKRTPMMARLQQLKKKSKPASTAKNLSPTRRSYMDQGSGVSSSGDEPFVQEERDEKRNGGTLISHPVSTTTPLIDSNIMRVPVEAPPTGATDQVSTSDITVDSCDVSFPANSNNQAKNTETANDVDDKITSESNDRNDSQLGCLPELIQVDGVVTDRSDTSDDEGKRVGSPTPCCNHKSSPVTPVDSDSSQQDDDRNTTENDGSVSLGKRKETPVANSTETRGDVADSERCGNTTSTTADERCENKRQKADATLRTPLLIDLEEGENKEEAIDVDIGGNEEKAIDLACHEEDGNAYPVKLEMKEEIEDTNNGHHATDESKDRIIDNDVIKKEKGAKEEEAKSEGDNPQAEIKKEAIDLTIGEEDEPIDLAEGEHCDNAIDLT